MLMKNPLFLSLLIALITLVSMGTGHSEEHCLALLKARCGDCHYLTRVCEKVESERSSNHWFGSSAGTWKRTIQNMVSQGAKLTEEEEQKLVACLSKPSPEIKDLCDLK